MDLSPGIIARKASWELMLEDEEGCTPLMLAFAFEVEFGKCGC